MFDRRFQHAVTDSNGDGPAAQVAAGIVDRLAGLDPILPAPHAAKEKSACFSHFYLCTTRNWILQAKDQPDPEFIHLLINNFFRLYEIYALDSVARNGCSDALHWQPFLGLLYRRRGTFLHRTRLLLLAARAHVRYDLSEAVFLTCQQYTHRFGQPPDLERIDSMIFGRASDPVFRRASRDFHAQCRANGSATAFTRFLAYCPHLWLPLLQSWRNRAWQDAKESIAAGRYCPPSLRKNTGRNGADISG